MTQVPGDQQKLTLEEVVRRQQSGEVFTLVVSPVPDERGDYRSELVRGELDKKTVLGGRQERRG